MRPSPDVYVVLGWIAGAWRRAVRRVSRAVGALRRGEIHAAGGAAGRARGPGGACRSHARRRVTPRA